MNSKFKFIVYLDNKERFKQFLISNIAAFTDYILPVSGLPAAAPLILEISDEVIYLKVKFHDFEYGEGEKIVSEIPFNEIKEFTINKINEEGVYHIDIIRKFQHIGLKCSNGLNDRIVKEIVDYVKWN